MATILANANGNWSSTSTWVGGVVPQPGDDVYANNKTVTIDVDVNVNILSNRADATSGAVAGGAFSIATAPRSVTFTQFLVAALTNTTTMTISHTSGIVTLNGTIEEVPSTNGGAVAVRIDSTAGEVIHNGNVKGGNAQANYGIVKQSTSLLTVNGSVFGTQSFNLGTEALYLSAGNTIVNGNVYGSYAGTSWQNGGINTINNATVTINGNLYNGTGGPSLKLANSASATVNGNFIFVTGATTHGFIISSSSGTITVNVPSNGQLNTSSSITGSSPLITMSGANATVNINGSVVMGSGSNLVGISGQNTILNINGNITSGTIVNNTDRGHIVNINTNFCTINFNSDATVGSQSPIVRLTSGTGNNIYFHEKVIGNLYGFGVTSDTNVSAVNFVTRDNKVFVNKFQAGPNGAWPINGFFYWKDLTTNSVSISRDGSTQKIVADNGVATGFLPGPADVRKGVTYGINGENTGTCSVPPDKSVAVGVPVDNTVGRAAIGGGVYYPR